MACPETLTAGDTLEFDLSFSDYPAGTWTATVYLRCGSSHFDEGLSASGTNHVGTVLPEVTATYPPGIYSLKVTVTDGTDRHVAYESQLIVKPDPAAASIALTALETELAAVDTAIAGVLAGEGVQAYTVQTQAGSRQIQRMSLQELRDHRRYLEGKIDQERVAMGETRKNTQWKRYTTKFA